MVYEDILELRIKQEDKLDSGIYNVEIVKSNRYIINISLSNLYYYGNEDTIYSEVGSECQSIQSRENPDQWEACQTKKPSRPSGAAAAGQ